MPLHDLIVREPRQDRLHRPDPPAGFRQRRQGFDACHCTDVRFELADRFGGLTAYSRAPAEGIWGDEGEFKRDDIVVFEVVVEKLNRNWWSSYRKALEQRFRQESIMMRVLSSEVL